MNYYLFRVWKDDSCYPKEILVSAESLEEAEENLSASETDWDDYSFQEEMYYDEVII